MCSETFSTVQIVQINKRCSQSWYILSHTSFINTHLAKRLNTLLYSSPSASKHGGNKSVVLRNDFLSFHLIKHTAPCGVSTLFILRWTPFFRCKGATRCKKNKLTLSVSVSNPFLTEKGSRINCTALTLSHGRNRSHVYMHRVSTDVALHRYKIPKNIIRDM